MYGLSEQAVVEPLEIAAVLSVGESECRMFYEYSTSIIIHTNYIMYMYLPENKPPPLFDHTI